MRTSRRPDYFPDPIDHQERWLQDVDGDMWKSIRYDGGLVIWEPEDKIMTTNSKTYRLKYEGLEKWWDKFMGGPLKLEPKTNESTIQDRIKVYPHSAFNEPDFRAEIDVLVAEHVNGVETRIAHLEALGETGEEARSRLEMAWNAIVEKGKDAS
jgi:hypothetical protein